MQMTTSLIKIGLTSSDCANLKYQPSSSIEFSPRAMDQIDVVGRYLVSPHLDKAEGHLLQCAFPGDSSYKSLLVETSLEEGMDSLISIWDAIQSTSDKQSLKLFRFDVEHLAFTLDDWAYTIRRSIVEQCQQLKKWSSKTKNSEDQRNIQVLQQALLMQVKKIVSLIEQAISKQVELSERLQGYPSLRSAIGKLKNALEEAERNALAGLVAIQDDITTTDAAIEPVLAYGSPAWEELIHQCPKSSKGFFGRLVEWLRQPENWSQTTKSCIYSLFLGMQVSQNIIQVQNEMQQRLEWQDQMKLQLGVTIQQTQIDKEVSVLAQLLEEKFAVLKRNPNSLPSLKKRYPDIWPTLENALNRPNAPSRPEITHIAESFRRQRLWQKSAPSSRASKNTDQSQTADLLREFQYEVMATRKQSSKLDHVVTSQAARSNRLFLLDWACSIGKFANSLLFDSTGFYDIFGVCREDETLKQKIEEFISNSKDTLPTHTSKTEQLISSNFKLEPSKFSDYLAELDFDHQKSKINTERALEIAYGAFEALVQDSTTIAFAREVVVKLSKAISDERLNDRDEWYPLHQTIWILLHLRKASLLIDEPKRVHELITSHEAFQKEDWTKLEKAIQYLNLSWLHGTKAYALKSACLHTDKELMPSGLLEMRRVELLNGELMNGFGFGGVNQASLSGVQLRQAAQAIKYAERFPLSLSNEVEIVNKFFAYDFTTLRSLCDFDGKFSRVYQALKRVQRLSLQTFAELEPKMAVKIDEFYQAVNRNIFENDRSINRLRSDVGLKEYVTSSLIAVNKIRNFINEKVRFSPVGLIDQELSNIPVVVASSKKMGIPLYGCIRNPNEVVYPGRLKIGSDIEVLFTNQANLERLEGLLRDLGFSDEVRVEDIDVLALAARIDEFLYDSVSGYCGDDECKKWSNLPCGGFPSS